MNEFSTKQGQLFYSFPIHEEEKSKIDAIMSLLDRSGVAEVIGRRARKGDGGRPPFNPYKLFAAVVLGFAFGQSSLREIESSCRNDLRFLYVLDSKVPDYSTISRFINEVILPQKEQLYSMIMRTLFGDCGIQLETCYIDGTKQEADANRYKFVWKPTRWHEKLDGKIRSLLGTMGLASDLPANGYL